MITAPIRLPIRTIDVDSPGVSVVLYHRAQDNGIEIKASFTWYATVQISEAEVMRASERGDGALTDVIANETRMLVRRLRADVATEAGK